VFCAGAHELASGSNYHLFKDGVEPKWEDPQNVRGGKWLLQMKVREHRPTEWRAMISDFSILI